MSVKKTVKPSKKTASLKVRSGVLAGFSVANVQVLGIASHVNEQG